LKSLSGTYDGLAPDNRVFGGRVVALYDARYVRSAFMPTSTLRKIVTILPRVLLATVLFLGSGSLFADDLAQIKQNLEKRFSDLKITEIKPSPLPGLYEVSFGTHVAFVSADGKYMLMGDLIDIESRKNLTAERRTALILKATEAVGEANMIVFAPEHAVKHTLTVFSDVDCPYCARLHREIPALTRAGVKVRYLLFPRAGVGSESYKRSVAVWCAKDRAQAVGTAMSGGKLAMKTCPNPVDEHLQLGADIGVQGTPTLILDDGRIIPGYLPAPELLAAMGIKDGKAPGTSPK
jgi:thiol:disulfide interchange protein DsbC